MVAETTGDGAVVAAVAAEITGARAVADKINAALRRTYRKSRCLAAFLLKIKFASGIWDISIPFVQRYYSYTEPKDDWMDFE